MASLSNFQPAPAPGPLDSLAAAAGSTACRPVRLEEVYAALGLIFSAGGRPAEDSQVMEFLQFADSRGISTRDIWVAERQGRVLTAMLPVFSPGKTVLLLAPGEAAPGVDPSAVPALIDTVCAFAARRGTHLAQVLLDPIDLVAEAMYGDRGFKRMAELVYLHTSVRRRAPIPPLGAGFGWATYSAHTHGLFANAILDSYQGSLDCPGLNGMRDIEDVIAGHKASGEFDAALWFVLCEALPGLAPSSTALTAASSTARAVLLLSRLPRSDAAELVYLGLVPEARGRGIGSMVLRHALGIAARIECARLTLAVDSNNTPALKLYYRHGMQRVTSKIAMMKDLRGNAEEMQK